ncbi:RagB/SusD family nutrient uptake outer membrane protein [Chitinophaga sp. sic0106]|uniref:RagB/SusD family nutrient uptake outer membrane protein n=1 Tax=Chitinophaga sp. sic0106 TaxID=2854785 RepID=UPI001C466E8A|nr:RagB/SusD family nutrient uptake outer membrane protein [Chitinophaga sp. sic0106]MBV7532990.1 RagB/SusD family nutrient uptake outer membrane protein [Chitinophaga sp. sic0106]
MKNIYKIGLLSLALFAGSCSKDYLETQPTDQVSDGTVFENTDNAKMAVNGLAKMMTMQYWSQGLNGEGTIKMYYGNYAGNNFYVNLPGWSSVINSTYNERADVLYDYYPWYYYYKLVANANAIIAKIDGTAGTEADKAFIKAQALTYRAYSFTMLAQLYCYRWQDSNNGSTDGLVVRLDQSTGDMPLSTLADTYKQIYADLDQAIDLYTKSGKTRSKFYEVDMSVAQAIYARAALNRQDYPTAETYAVKARANYPLMSVAEYKDGFATSNQEWIWGSFGASDETLYYYSYHAYIGYNSSASAVRTYPKCISKELYNKIPETDIRKGLFLDPKTDNYTTATGVAGSAMKSRAFAAFPALQSNATIYAYMQFKIGVADQPGVGNMNHFRSSEMYLIEAEAKYFQNKPATEVQQVLESLTKTSGRDASYTCTKTGTALLDEIKTYRALELWGEGFDWFDMKRWNDPIIRKDPSQGGNFLTALAVTIQPSERNKWTWKIPLRESDYNGALE